MELQVFVNGTRELDWKAVFPDYATQANFHNWKPYPNMGTVTLAAGLQVIKLDTGADPHLNLDYVQFSLVQPDGGLEPSDDGGEAGSPDDAGSAPIGDAAATREAGGAGADAGTGDELSSAGAGGCGCRVAPSHPNEEHLAGALAAAVALVLVGRRERRDPVSLRNLQDPKDLGRCPLHK
jgi:MYXO-CTERM domain-containing protein